MNEIAIARPSDDADVVGLLIRSFDALYAEMGVTMSADRARYLADQRSRRAFATTFLCLANDTVIGTVAIVPPSPQCEAWIAEAWDLRLLAVEPGMQGRGVARDLMRFAEQWADSAGASALCLRARAGVDRQARFYRSCAYHRDLWGDLDGDPRLEGYSKYFAASS